MPTDQIVQLDTHHIVDHGMSDPGSNLTNKPAVAVPPGAPRRPLINADHPGRVSVLHEAFGLAPQKRSLGSLVREDPKKLEWDFVLERAKANVADEQRRKAAQRSVSVPGL
jgi:hypothetical protein